MENVVFTKSYLDSLCKMSFTMRGRADLAMMQFMEDKNQKGLNFEKLSGCRENNIFPIRIAGGFRTILGRIPELDAYVFLYADQHDSAYAWAQKVVISLNSETKTVQMYSALVDKLVRLNTVSGYEGANILYDKKPLRQLWERAISVGDPQRLRPADFYQREWSAVIAEREAFTLEAYLAAKRTGGGKPLSQKQRREVWPVFEAYQALMEEKRQFDYKTAAYRYLRAVEERAVPQYHHIIVEEAQDLITGSLRLLRALAGPEREDDIFLVRDTRQQIYDRRVSLSDCGIRVQGRILRLHVNYRTTYQLQSSAIRMLEGETFDDLNGGEDPQQRYTPCTLGPSPYVNILDNSEEELQRIISEARRLIDCGVPAKNICLTVPTIQQVGQYIKRLGSRGFRTYELKNKADDQGLEGIRIGTMYRVKGLEFQYMFIAGINQGEFPPASIGQSKDALKRAKCLLYVALTRAQKGAYVSGCGKPTSSFLLQLKRVAEQVAKE